MRVLAAHTEMGLQNSGESGLRPGALDCQARGGGAGG
jgi:hypothetical protein